MSEPVRHVPKPTRKSKAKRHLARYVRPKAKRATPRRAPYKTSDPAREAWCRKQEWCISQGVEAWGRCEGAIEASHLGPRATAKTAPQCHRHHREWHGATGFCKGWNRAKRDAWALDMLAFVDRFKDGTL
jgi:hypothetical protein